MSFNEQKITFTIKSSIIQIMYAMSCDECEHFYVWHKKSIIYNYEHVNGIHIVHDWLA